MTARARAFVTHYLGKAGGNATKAAILAGYAKSSAHVTGSKLLRNAKVRALLIPKVEEKQARVELEAIATADERDKVLTQALRDAQADWNVRIRAAVELNKCNGRHSINVNHAGKLTIEEALGFSRSPELDQAPK